MGTKLEEMLQINKELEEGAIELYREIISKAEEEGDTVTADIFHRILADEEDHHDTFSGLLEKS